MAHSQFEIINNVLGTGCHRVVRFSPETRQNEGQSAQDIGVVN